MKIKFVNFILLLSLVFCLFACDNNKQPDDPINERPERPHIHSYEDWVVVEEASLFNIGKKEKKCENCDVVISEDIYYLDEVSFEDKVYQYSGQKKKLLIEGLLPTGIKVKYKNNELTNVGSVTATAEFINEDNEVIAVKTATLTVVDYKGFPKVSINTNNQPILNKEDYVVSTISISNCDDKYILNEVSAGVRLRGNGTLEAAKKPYRIKFEKKQSMLGLNDGLKAKSWVLLADYYDYSMSRNASAFYLGNSLLNSKDYYSTSYQYVNLYINGIYNGVYLLAEQQQANEGRVEISEPESNYQGVDIGYLLELDSYAVNEGDYFNLNLNGYQVKDYRGNTVNLSSMSYAIKSDYFSNAQKNHIDKYLNNVFKIMYKAITANEYYCFNEDYDLVTSEFSNSYDTINNVINLDSMFRVYILQEIMKNVDVGFSSFYMYVDFSSESKHPRLTFGAPWDFDWSSGNVAGEPYYSSSGHFNDSQFNHSNPWLLTLSNADFFDNLIKDYWEVFANSQVMEGLIYQLDEISSTYGNDFNQNFTKWNILGTKQHVYSTDDVFNFNSQSDAKDYLKDWLTKRESYLNTLWDKGE